MPRSMQVLAEVLDDLPQIGRVLVDYSARLFQARRPGLRRVLTPAWL